MYPRDEPSSFALLCSGWELTCKWPQLPPHLQIPIPCSSYIKNIILYRQQKKKEMEGDLGARDHGFVRLQTRQAG